MIGNDVIDLDDGVGKYPAERRQRWLRKIALSSELKPWQGWPEDLWPDILWSIKESVFKCSSRRQFSRTFAPRDIELINLERLNKKRGKSLARLGGDLFWIEVFVEEAWLHAVASLERTEVRWQQIELASSSNPAQQSLQLRSAFEHEIQSKIPGKWQMKESTEALPELLGPFGKFQNFSFSHHGRFGAWSYLPSCLSSSEFKDI